MTIFYCPTLSEACVLSEEESLHAAKVLRLKAGDAIQIVDGKGSFYNARITAPHHKHCGFEITGQLIDESNRDYKLHIAIAPTKNIDRIEWFIEKATEIGIDEITALFCHNSERKIIKEERLEKIIVSASKQSLKSKFPVLNPSCSFTDFLKSAKAEQQFIAHCYNEDKRLLQNCITKGTSVIILIGPEGDFSKEEVEAAIKNGYQPVSLGNSRLRTETAGVVACCTLAIANQ